jgi:hypothetical protein
MALKVRKTSEFKFPSQLEESYLLGGILVAF